MNFNDLKKHLVYLDKAFIEGEVYRLQECIIIQKKVKSAKILMTGFGQYDVYLNDQKIGDQLFKPGFTYYKEGFATKNTM